TPPSPPAAAAQEPEASPQAAVPTPRPEVAPEPASQEPPPWEPYPEAIPEAMPEAFAPEPEALKPETPEPVPPVEALKPETPEPVPPAEALKPETPEPVPPVEMTAPEPSTTAETPVEPPAATPASPVAEAPDAPPAAMAPASPQAPSTSGLLDQADWLNRFESLGLGGLTRNLAAHCVVEGDDGQTLRLRLDPSQSAMNAEVHHQRIQAALAAQDLPRRLVVDVAELPAGVETPQARAERLAAERHAEAVAALKADPRVQQLQETFGARLQESSVTPQTPTS
ncbi:DNA polymerase III subunit gamma/tau C-terminal domain-containing protein, partial [Halomonas sp. NCCP-2165]